MSAFDECIVERPSFVIPTRAILDSRDMDKWKTSQSHDEIFSFVKKCTESVVGKRRSDIQEIEDGSTASPIVTKFVSFMKHMSSKMDDFPPLKQPMRFGNKAFRQWHECLKSEIIIFLNDLLPNNLIENGCVDELAPYLHTAFGNEIRIDYGTGHETTLIVFFMCLYKLKLILDNELNQVILYGFVSYINTMRKLQTGYLLEPAGSHGVWGLDDYHCLTFLFGSAQLCSQENDSGIGSGGVITPTDIHNIEILNEYSTEYLYLEGIQFIKILKTGASFAETSPMLNDISHLGDWNRICKGLLKLYEAEVLSKFPVVQHLLFGTIVVPPPTASITGQAYTDEGVGGTRMDAPLMHGMSTTVRPQPGMMMSTVRPTPGSGMLMSGMGMGIHMAPTQRPGPNNRF
jgi:hypothetical protein